MRKAKTVELFPVLPPNACFSYFFGEKQDSWLPSYNRVSFFGHAQKNFSAHLWYISRTFGGPMKAAVAFLSEPPI